MPRTGTLPGTVRSARSIAALPIDTRVMLFGRRVTFTYTRTPDGWREPAATLQHRQQLLGPIPVPTGPKSNQELADLITALGRPAQVLPRP